VGTLIEGCPPIRAPVPASQRGSYHEEPTAYRGHHYVEVYIVKDGRCVAMDRQRVQVV
jgi:hypothetical protein